MNEIKCPKCGTVFQINETDYDSIVKQIRDNEFEKELLLHEKQHKINEENSIKIAVSEKEKEYHEIISKKDLEINELKNELKLKKTETELEISKAISKKDKEIDTLTNKIELNKNEYLLKEKSLKDNYEEKINNKDE